MTDETQSVTAPIRRLNPRTLGALALEVFSIVLGVLLALAVSEWQEDRDNTERARAALVNVRNELEANIAILDATLAQNQSTVAAIEAYTGASEGSERLGYAPAVRIDDAAWRALGDSGLTSFIDYDLLLELSRLYASVNVYQRVAYGLIEADMSVRAARTAAGVEVGQLQSDSLFARNFLIQFQTLARGEAQLIDAHRALLERLPTTFESDKP